MYIILGILLFGLLIAVHEGGHFAAAKLLDVKVNEFSIGMGPTLFSRQKGETEYSLRILPFGGFCAMEGENEAGDDPRSFGSKSAWKRILILFAGPGANVLAGFILTVLILTVAGGYSVPVIDSFLDGFPCQGEYGLMEGDRIVRVNGHRIFLSSEVAEYLSQRQDGADITVRRDGQTVALKDLPLSLREYQENGETVLRYGLYFTRENVSFPGVLRQSADTCCYFARAVESGLAMMIRGQVGVTDMSGPVGVVSYLGEMGSSSESIAAGVMNVLYFIALISINLALMNLLPLPALDGGRIFFIIIGGLVYLVARRRIPERYETLIHAAGFCLLLLFMAVITVSDVWKLIP